MEESAGQATMTRVREAYAAFALDMRAVHLDDDHIIGVFKSRVADAPLQEVELREALLVIGRHRNSSKLENFASNCEPQNISIATSDLI